MEKTMTVMDHAQYLQSLSDQIFRLEGRINKITTKLSEIDPGKEDSLRMAKQPAKPNHLDFSHVTGGRSNITPFPGVHLRSERKQNSSPILAMPGKHLPADIPDFRPVLQRDGLILLGWDKRKTEKGELYTAYWVTSNGIPRFYASKQHKAEDFSLAQPDRKSYAAEDGIEFYGQEAPACIVHVAPELMMSNPQHRKLRYAHIKTLKENGISVDFNYKYLLTKERSRNMPAKNQKGLRGQKTGA